VVWRDTPTPYGPLFILLAGAAAAVGSQVAAIAIFRLLAVLGVVGIGACLPVLARRLNVPPERALWLVLCCPLVPVHLVGGGHNDALTLAFLVAGLAVLAARPRQTGLLILGGVLLGLSISVKITLGVVLPFAALLAVGGLPPGGWPRLLRRGGTVLVAALGTLVGLSFLAGLGLGWATALSGAGESVNWSSPPTAIGIAVAAAGRWVGADVDILPAVRAVALVLLPIALAVILWRSRRRDPLIGAGLALLAVIFLAPITQPWYLMWPLAVIAATPARARWLAGTIAFAMATVLPDGTGSLRPLGVPMSFAMMALIAWVALRSLRWLRGDEVVTHPQPAPQSAAPVVP
jgi:4-amino-4-deoxy-L-arabinose transferase-like glycosyltransferase